jgi:hypothetical protein
VPAHIRRDCNIALDIPAGLEHFHAGRGSPDEKLAYKIHGEKWALDNRVDLSWIWRAHVQRRL